MKKLISIMLILLALSACHASAIPESPTTLSALSTAETAGKAEHQEQAPTSFLPPVAEHNSQQDTAEQLLASMTTEEKVNQIFLIRSPVYGPSHSSVGGYVLFSEDIHGHTPETLQAELQQYQHESAIPLLIAVDEEGGSVCRISIDPEFRHECFPSPRTAFASGGMEAVFSAEREKAELLSELGINVILGPVCDITTLPSAFMYSRSLGQTPDICSEFVVGTVAIMDRNRIGSVLKHFPGYGNNSDTHIQVAVDHRSLEELKNCDLVPFQAGMDAGCGAVMVSHTIITCLDAEMPATLSPAVHDFIRKEMNYDGVIVTDELSMGAISAYCSSEEAAILAVLAGNDLLCTKSYETQFYAVLDAVNTGRISEEQLNNSVLRILRWKSALGLLP